jgi:hypothetical protein
MDTRHSIVRVGAAALLGLCAGMSVLASADGMTQPDPPVPAEALFVAAAAVPQAVASLPSAVEPECRCAVLHARDLEGRVEGHVELWQALEQSATRVRHAAARNGVAPLRPAYVEGVVGFPVRDFRLAQDDRAESR